MMYCIAMLTGDWLIYILAGVLLLLAILLLAAVAWMISTRHKEIADKEKDADTSKSEDDESNGDDGKTVRGFAPAFLSAMTQLRHQVAGRDYRYRVPWYLMMGPPDSGKTTLLTDSHLRHLLEEDGRGFAGDQSIGWKFYGDGIVLDAAGIWSLGKSDHESANWKRLLRLLNRHRPQRPLDGIIVTIACTDLVGPDALDQSAMLQRAALLYDRLRQTQQILGFRLPVYFVITKCDFIPGFHNFCQELPAERLRDMFGWSSPYNLDTAFDPSWLDEAFLELRNTIEQTQNEIFAQRDYTENRQEMFLFPGELMSLYGPLRIFLSRALRSTAYRESYYFRGIYFTGDFKSEEESPQAKSDFLAPRPTSLAWSLPETSLIPPIFEAWNNSEERIAFVYDLFVKKIFIERGIAHPVSNYFYTRNRTTIALQIVTALAVIILAVGTSYNYLRLQQAKGTLVPLLGHIDRDLKVRHLAKDTGQALEASDRSDAGDLLLAMASFQTRNFRSIFLPTSWISPIDSSVRSAMVPAFRVLVLEHFRDGLERRAAEITNPADKPLPAVPAQSGVSANSNFNLQMLPEYQQLRAYVGQLQALENNIALYESIRKNGSSADISTVLDLENYISGRKLRVDVDESQNAYFEQALQQATWEPFVYRQSDIQHASQKMELLTTNFFSAWIEKNPILLSLQDLSAKLSQIDDSSVVTYNQLVTLQQAFHATQTGFSAPDLQWVAADNLSLTGEMYAVTMAPIKNSQYLQTYLQQWIPYTANQSFSKLADGISDQQSKITGPLAEVDDQKLVFTDETEKVEIALDNLMNLPFVAKSNGQTISAKTASNVQIEWNNTLLEEATEMPDTYNHYIQEDLQNAPANLRSTFERIANQRLSVAMEDQAVQAENILPVAATGEGLSLEQDILPAVQNFQASSDALSQLLNMFRQLGMTDSYNRLNRVASNEAAGLLVEVDKAFNADQPYVIPESAYNNWLGENPPTISVLGAHTPEDVQSYLSVQREQIFSYSKAAAPLVHFLQMQHAELSPDAQKSLIRWQKINAELKQYDDKRPGNSLALLESFISTDMDKMSPAHTCTGNFGSALNSQAADYFLQVRSSIRLDLYKRCHILNTFNVARDYANLSGIFNRELAGHFPFAPLSYAQKMEADPEAVRDFYQVFDADAGLIRQALQQHNSFGASGAAVLVFLDQMQNTRQLFLSILGTQNQASLPAVDFVPHFRVNQSREINGNQIIAWTLKVGQSVFQPGTPEQTGRWTYGQPVTLTLRWAKDSPLMPLLNIARPGVDLSGRTLTYAYNDSWALLSMLADHRAPITEFDQLVDPQPFTLMFQTEESGGGAPVHTDNSKSIARAKVFLGVTLFPPGKKESLQNIDFPARAPSLLASTSRMLEAGGVL